jgi:protein O-GlcNAc transferase
MITDTFKQPAALLPIDQASDRTGPQAIAPSQQEINTLVALYTEGNLTEAANLAKTLTTGFPLYGFGWMVRGMVHDQMGRDLDALAFMQKAAALSPNDALVHNNLGNIHNKTGHLVEAEASLRRALEINPAYADAHCNLGSTLQDQGRLIDAEASFCRALEIMPEMAGAHYNLGNTLKKLMRLSDAVASYRRALQIKPDHVSALCNLGSTLYDLGRLNEAEQSYRSAIKIDPDNADAHYNLGITLNDLFRLEEAVQESRHALQIRPDLAQAYNSLGCILQKRGQHDEAVANFRRAIELKPDYSIAHSNLIFVSDLLGNSDALSMHEERKRWDAAHAARLNPHLRHTNLPDPDRRLRIAYVSADFRGHSAAKAFGCMLTGYDRSQFDVYAYSNYKGFDDSHTELFKQNASCWRNIAGLSDDVVAEMIREDQIDILVDLSGHSAGNRLLVFARKPAPIQITAWGYAAGTGMSAMDVFFADPVMVPLQDQQYFTEEVRYLPCVVGAFFKDKFPELNELPALSGGIVTFGSLNRMAKGTAQTYNTWAKVLLAVPDSRLLLKAAELDDETTRESVIACFTRAGVAAHRIVMLGASFWYEHMQAYHQIDIALDPFPQGGGVTSLEGLMMGVPLVTLRSPVFVGRVSASIMTALGLTDWIAETEETYIALAKQKASDLQSLALLRRQLRGIFTSSAIGKSYAKAVEQEFRKLWNEWCARASKQHQGSDTAEQSFQQAVVCHRAGQLQAAEELYHTVLLTLPDHPEANHNLGILAVQSERVADALPYFIAALNADPECRQYWLSYIDALLEANQPEDAREVLVLARQHGLQGNEVDIFETRLAESSLPYNQPQEVASSSAMPDQLSGNSVNCNMKKPNQSEINVLVSQYSKGSYTEAASSAQSMVRRYPEYGFGWMLLGMVFKQTGRKQEGLAAMQKSVALLPMDADAHNNLGISLKDMGRLSEAEASYLRALALKPDMAEAYYNLGNTLKDMYRLMDAEASFQKALQLKPDNVQVLSNLGAILQELGRLEEAEARCRQAIQINPEYAEVHYNLGITLHQMGRAEDAEASYRQALRINPDQAEVLYNLGITLKEMGRLSEAEASYRQALRINPDYAEAYTNLGGVLQKSGLLVEALTCFRRALEIKPACAMTHSNLIFTLDMMDGSDPALLHLERQRWDAAHAAHFYQQRAYHNTTEPERRLRIAYVSSDFRAHSASKVFGSMLTRFACAQFDVFIYNNFKGKDDRIAALFKQNVTVWRDIANLSDDAVAEMIREDRIDILVDLSGHSAGNRLLVFARKPAPIQITAWGYAEGTGMRAMDVFFADPVIVPLQDQQYFTEQIRYLPCMVGSFFTEPFPEVNELPALSEGGVTFGSLNRLAKISAAAFDAWAKILLAVPHSRLIIKTAELNDAFVRERIAARFAGVAADRIILLGKTSWYEHMQVNNQIDIALDPFPQGGGLTSLEGLMMGVPMVTFRSPAFIGRASASIMTTLGLTDWIAETEEAYIALAMQKANDLQSLALLRRQLRGIFTSSVIGNPEAYATAVEQEYRKLWHEWCARAAKRRQASGTAEQSFQQAVVCHRDGQSQAAAELYHTVLLTLPEHPEANHNLGVLALQSERPAEALPYFIAALNADPECRQYWLSYIDALLEAKQPEEAREVLVLARQQGLQGNEVDVLETRLAGSSLPHNAPQPQEAASSSVMSDESSVNLLACQIRNPGQSEINVLVSQYSKGSYIEAASSAQSMVERFPEYGFGWMLLGMVFKQLGRKQEGLAAMQKSVALSPMNADAHNNLGIALKDMGRLVDAQDCYLRALALKPDMAEAYYNLGNTQKDMCRLIDAEASFQKALQLKPDNVQVLSNLGAILQELGRLEEAEARCRQAIQINPDYAEVHYNLAITLKEMGRYSDAEASYRQALQTNPDYAEAHSNLGITLHEMGRHSDAEACYRQALLINPNYAEAHSNLGITLMEMGRHRDAEASYRQALQINPDYAEAHNNLGITLHEMGRLSEAEAGYRQALRINPDYAEAHSNLGSLLQKRGLLAEALACFRRALEIKPDYAMMHSNLIFTQDMMADSDPALLVVERQRWDAAHAAHFYQQRAYLNTAEPERRLRIAYVSSDFRAHSAARVFGSMLTHFARTQFEVFVYNNFKGEEDRVAALFKQNVTVWRDIIGLSDDAVAERIREDRIDILVDLSGHSGGNRLLVFARKPAPIQITAWGYATGTGMRAMDVFLADPVIAPPQEQQYFTEQVRYLPCVVGAFFTEPFPDVNELPALSDGIVTFGSLNRLAKISDAAFGTWAKILAAVPDSRLIIKTTELKDAFVRERIAAHFAGMAADRIILLGKTSWYEHMQVSNQIDIALDPFPQSGGVTTLEGLMMGVPVVTLRWPTIIGRVSASIMTTLGLTDWIAETEEAYIALAIKKASDLQSLALLRRQLRGIFTASVIGNPEAYAAAVEQEYRQLWHEWCVGK